MFKDWLQFILRFFSDLLALLRKKKRLEREREEQAAAEREAGKQRAEQDIQDAVNRVQKPKLDPGGSAPDPMGVDRWNRGR